MDQSQYSSPENAGNQPPPDASAPFAGNFPAPVGPPVQPAAVRPARAPADVRAAPASANGASRRRRTATRLPAAAS